MPAPANRFITRESRIKYNSAGVSNGRFEKLIVEHKGNTGEGLCLDGAAVAGMAVSGSGNFGTKGKET